MSCYVEENYISLNDFLNFYNNYLWTYDLYGPAHKDFDASDG